MNFGSLPRLKIQIKSNGVCTRECPNIPEAEPNHMPLPGTMVGSFLCRRCSYFAMVEPRMNAVVCKFGTRGEENAQTQMQA